MSQGFLSTSLEGEARLLSSRSLVVLIGGFDGSANYGDIIQARVALRRAHCDAGIATVAIVVEDALADAATTLLDLGDDTVVLRFSDMRPEQQLEQLPAHTLVYLYGGGYLVEEWSLRRLREVQTVQHLIHALSPISNPRIAATGLQVGPHDEVQVWASWLLHSEPLAVRDESSKRLLVEQGIPASRIVDYGDDAAGEILSLAVRRTSGDPCINLHISLMDYATRDPKGRIEATCALLRQLATEMQGLRCKLLIAYEDARIDEHHVADAIIDRYASESGALPIHFETVSLITSMHSAIELGSTGTITSSYHVGLTSLLHGLPTVLLADNDYYQHKMQQLADLFSLPVGCVIAIGEVHDTRVSDRLHDAAASLALHHQSAVALIAARADAAESAVRTALLRFERDVVWSDAGDIFAHYRTLAAQTADLTERKRYLEVHLAACRQEVDQLKTELNAASTGGVGRARPTRPDLA